MNMPIRDDWAELIPHRGTMRLLEAIQAWDPERLHARSASHRRPDHPLRRDGGLHAVHLIEYAAQATAVHGALSAADQGRAPPAGGRLVSLRDVDIGCDRVDDIEGCLDIHVEKMTGGLEGAHYLFRVLAADTVLVSGRMAVMYGPRN